MTRLVRIHGLNKAATGMATRELNDRARLVKPSSFVDTAALSEGEMAIFLRAQRAKMLAEFYPDRPEYAADFNRLRDVLYNGLHQGIGFSYLPERLASRPASGWLTWQEKGTNPAQGIKLLFDDAPNGAIRGVGAIPKLNCDVLFPTISTASLQASNVPATLWPGIIQQRNDQRLKCETENIWRTELNRFWEKTGTTLVYEFLTLPGNVGVLPQLAQKQLRHKDFVEMVRYGSKISRNNLRLWMENGIMASSIQGANGQSMGPGTAADLIDLLRRKGQAGVGAFPLIVIPIAIAIIALNAAGLKRLIQVITGKQALTDAIRAHVGEVGQFFEKYANDLEVLANPSDFDPNATAPNACDPGFTYDPVLGECLPDAPGGGGGGGGTALAIDPLLIGGGVLALFLLTRGNKK